MHLPEIFENNILHGKHALYKLRDLLKEYKNILLLRGEKSFEKSGANIFFEDALKNIKYHMINYKGKLLSTENVQEVYDRVKNLQYFEAIIAVGGGTIIDLAKLVAISISTGNDKIEDLLRRKKLVNYIDLIFIPTTCGTGSEETNFAVIYKNRVKYSVICEELKPKIVILDPELLLGLPEEILNATILDSLAQAIESIWAVGSTEESISYACRALKMILKNICKRKSINKLYNLLIASHFSGKAIKISKTTASHAISYPLTAYYGIPHGISVFLTLPNIASFNYKTSVKDIQGNMTLDKLMHSFSLLFKVFRVDSIEKFCNKLNKIMTDFGFSIRLRDYKIKEEDLKTISEMSINEGRSDNNPRIINNKDIFKILKEIF